jgi:penicillin-insensitive murein DD-endopeptidase
MRKQFGAVLILISFSILGLIACSNQNDSTVLKGDFVVVNKTDFKSPIDSLQNAHRKDSLASQSIGSVGNGKLINGRLVPYSGVNFFYFDSTSYMNKRAFVHEKVLKVVLETYKKLENSAPEYSFGIMECSNEKGGKIDPHHTHQNGLSIDFMSPLIVENVHSQTYDFLGGVHYMLEFNENGILKTDQSHQIDFDKIALHLLELNEQAKKKGLKIQKVIFKLELLDELFATPNGKKLKTSGIYFAKKLPTLINSLHDDHYHVDFSLS